MPTRRTLLVTCGSALAGGTGIGWVGRGWFSSDSETLSACDCPTRETNQLYEAVLLDVVDGDTVDLLVDLGLNTRRKIRVRISELDTAEVRGVSETSDEYRLGMEQRQFVEEHLSSAEELIYRSEEDRRPFGERYPDDHESPRNGQGGFGRWLGDINMDGRWLSEIVLERWPNARYEG